MPLPYLPTYDPETYDPYGEQPNQWGRREYSGGSTQTMPTVVQPGAPSIPYYGNQGGGGTSLPVGTTNQGTTLPNMFDFNSIWEQAQKAYGSDAIQKFFDMAQGNLNRAAGTAGSLASRTAGGHSANMLNPASFVMSALSQSQAPYAQQQGQLQAAGAQAQQQGQAQLTQMLYLINRAKQGDQEAANQLKLAYDTGAEQVRQFNAQREDSGAGLLDWIFGLGNTAANMYSSGIFGGKQAASGSSGLGMGGAWFSDIRLKKNIKKIGEMKGINIYKWDWEDNVEEIVGDSPTVGVIAQEVAHIPNAVIMDKSGYLKVDYRWI